MADVRKIVDLSMLDLFKTLMEAEITGGDAAVEAALKAIIGTPTEGKTIVQMIAEAKSEATYDDTAVKKSISDLETLVGVLPEGATVSTVVAYIDQQVQIAKNQAKAAQDDVDSLETLVGTLPEDAVSSTVVAYAKEVADGKDAAIKAAKDAADQAQSEVDALETYVGTIPAGATATDVVSYAKEVADAAAGDASQVAADLAQEITDRQADTKAIKDSIGTVTEGETVVSMIADAKKAGTDANTALETYKTTNDAAVEAAQTQADKGVTDAAKAQKTADDLNTLVGFTAGTGEDDPKTVKAYIDSEVAKATGDASQVATDLATEVTRATGAEEALGGRIDDVEDLIGEIEAGSTVAAEIGKAEQNAKDYADDLVEGLGSVLNFKGIVDTEADLPTEGNKQGDVYNVKTTARGTSAEFVYITDKGWEELGDVLDLSAYDTRTVTEGKIATAKSEAITAANGYTDSLVGEIKDSEGAVVTVKSYVDGLDSAMDARMDVVEAAIGAGGSVAAQIKAEIEKLDATVTNEVEGEAKPDVTVTVVETDGKLTSVNAVVNAKYDVEGAAKAIQGETTSTVKDVEDALTTFEATISYAEKNDIEKLFEKESSEA